MCVLSDCNHFHFHYTQISVGRREKAAENKPGPTNEKTSYSHTITYQRAGMSSDSGLSASVNTTSADESNNQPSQQLTVVFPHSSSTHTTQSQDSSQLLSVDSSTAQINQPVHVSIFKPFQEVSEGVMGLEIASVDGTNSESNFLQETQSHDISQQLFGIDTSIEESAQKAMEGIKELQHINADLRNQISMLESKLRKESSLRLQIQDTLEATKIKNEKTELKFKHKQLQWNLRTRDTMGPILCPL